MTRTKLNFSCKIFHTEESTANAVNFAAIYYLAPYMVIENITRNGLPNKTQMLNFTVKGSSVVFMVKFYTQ